MKIQNLLVILTYLYIISINFVPIVSQKHYVQTRIVGGRRTDIIKLGGFLVALRIAGAFLCGGSYVSNRVVISAAHCVIDYMESVNLLSVQGGISNLKEKSPRIQVVKVLIPDMYNDRENDLDVAVLLLKTPLHNPKIQKINLCDHYLKKGDTVSVYGWGLGNVKDKKHKLQVETIDIPVVEKSHCQEMFKNMIDVTESMLCAGVPYEKDACQYDSGGPLVHNGQLCGIVSFGVDCASAYPGVYSDVKNLADWIKNAIDKILS